MLDEEKLDGAGNAADAENTPVTDAKETSSVEETSNVEETTDVDETSNVEETSDAEEITDTEKTADAPSPEESISDEQTAVPDESESQIRSAEQDTSVKYRWIYADEVKHERPSAKKHGGVLTYAIVMTVAFAVCLTALLGVLFIDSGALRPNPTRTIYVREYDTESGVLTVPEIADKVKPSVVAIKMRYEDEGVSGVGSGIIISKDGYIITNHHVVEDSTGITVILDSKDEYQARLIGSDELADLALIKIEATDLVPAEIGNSDDLIVGELAVAIGTPSSIDFAGTTTVGHISATNLDLKIYDTSGIMEKRMTVIQTDASVNPGNSGGALVNERGQIIGVVSMRLGINYTGIGFAIPINQAMVIINDIMATGSSSHTSLVANRRPLIGITAGGVKAGEARQLDDGRTVTADVDGVIIVALTPGLDAQNKLSQGDIIISVDGKDVFTVSDVMDIVNSKKGGDSVLIHYYRAGGYYDVTVRLGTES